MWQLKTSIIQILVDAQRLVKKGTAKDLEKVPSKQNLAKNNLTKIVLTSTAHILFTNKLLILSATPNKSKHSIIHECGTI